MKMTLPPMAIAAAQRALQPGVGERVHGGRGLVEQHHPRLPHARTREAEQLALPDRERPTAGALA